ncbi:hypothetical protein [Cupriavidus pampae]|uniref:hypothetical protein n=1 Tax=Cupriavidus pampae TaxID=659251 RepID=UPI001CC33CB9|nr:hypothetical protein [Cupriavidus pampae]
MAHLDSPSFLLLIMTTIFVGKHAIPAKGCQGGVTSIRCKATFLFFYFSYRQYLSLFAP